MTKTILLNEKVWEGEWKRLYVNCCGNIHKQLGMASPKRYPCLLIWHRYISDGKNKNEIEYDFIYPGDI